MSSPTGFATRRPNAPLLPTFELPPPPQKYRRAVSTTQASQTPGSLVRVGNLLTPPTSGDILSPEPAGIPASRTSSIDPPYTIHGAQAWPPFPRTASAGPLLPLLDPPVRPSNYLFPGPYSSAYPPVLHPTHGPVLSNLNNPNFPPLLRGALPQDLISFNSGHAANLQHTYNNNPRPTCQPTHNDRPFKCDQCPQNFNRNHDLKRHKRIHLAGKPFPCGHCDKSFSRKDALKRHILVKGCGRAQENLEAKKQGSLQSPNGHEAATAKDFHPAILFRDNYVSSTPSTNSPPFTRNRVHYWERLHGVLRLRTAARVFIFCLRMKKIGKQAAEEKIIVRDSGDTSIASTTDQHSIPRSLEKYKGLTNDLVSNPEIGKLDQIECSEPSTQNLRSRGFSSGSIQSHTGLDGVGEEPVSDAIHLSISAGMHFPQDTKTLQTERESNLCVKGDGKHHDNDISSAFEDSTDSFSESCWSPWIGSSRDDPDSIYFRPSLENLRSRTAQALLDQFLRYRVKQVQGLQDGDDCSRSSDSAQPDSRVNHTSTIQPGHQPISKRNRDDDPCEDDEEGRVPKRSRKVLRQDVTDNRLLACPYCKHNPARYRGCYGKVLKEISRLKQHLARCHRIPIHCPICSLTFESEENRDDHVRQLNCQLSESKTWDGINEVQKKQLEKRVNAKKSKEENWYAIYEILFPGARRPDSPYLDARLTEELLALSEFARSEGPNIIEPFIANNLPEELQPQRDEISSFAMTLVPNIFDLILERWDRVRLSPSSPRNEGIRSESGYVSEEGNQSSSSLLIPRNDPMASHGQDPVTTNQEPSASDLSSSNTWEWIDQFGVDGWLTTFLPPVSEQSQSTDASSFML